MATLKAVVLRHQLREDGTYNVKIRVTHERQTAYIATEHYIGKKQITADCKRIKDNFILSVVEMEIARLRKEISNLGSRVSLYSAKALAEHLDKFRKPGSGERLDFFRYSEKKIAEIREAGRKSTADMYYYSMENLKSWLKRDTLDFKEITVRFLRDYENYLRSLDKMGGRGLEANLAAIRAIFNFAREEYNDDELDEIRIPNYPFTRYKIPRPEEPEQRAISIRDLLSIRSFVYEPGPGARKDQPSRPELARDVFLLSFYLVGMNGKDMFWLDKISGERITYQRAKTKDRRSDRAEISIRIRPEAREIIDKYRDPSGKRAFNFYRRYTDERTFNSAVNKGLKVVGEACKIENLEFYSARHTWATIARNECSISVDDISLALNHTDIYKKVTFKYIKKDFSRIDEANDRVLDLIKHYSASGNNPISRDAKIKNERPDQ